MAHVLDQDITTGGSPPAFDRAISVVLGVVGNAATIPYAIAAPSAVVTGGTLTLVINIGLHLVGSVAVIVALLVSPTEHWNEGQM